MPDFDLLHEKATKLARLTHPDERQPGLFTWSMMVGQLWKEIVEMWTGKPEARRG